jgi:predicted GNAT family N-acyltransferase
MNTIPLADFRVEPADYVVDFADLRAVREQVFVLEQKVPLELEWDELDPKCRHVIARDAGNQPIGTGRLTPEHTIGRMAVLPAWRGKGVGAALLQTLLERAQDLGWTEVSLHAQVSAIGFYRRHGFTEVGEVYEEAGIPHRTMTRSLAPAPRLQRGGVPPRPESVRPEPLDDLPRTIAASASLIGHARREVRIYTRDLEIDLNGNAAVIDALREFSTRAHAINVRILIHDPASPQGIGHLLLPLAQRMSSVFEFRTPTDDSQLQYPAAYLLNDADGFLFRPIASRYEGEWSLAWPARHRQLTEEFDRAWAYARPCTELRALGI